MKREYIILIVIVLGAMFLLPSVWNLGTKAINDFWANLWAPFKKFGAENAVALTLEIEYKDGTKRQFNSSLGASFTIMDSGLEVKAITGAVTISATHAAPSSEAWAVEGVWTIEIFQGTTKIADMGDPSFGQKRYAYSTPTPFISGQQYTINSGTIKYDAQQIETTLSGKFGDYTMVFKTQITLSINFGQGQTDTKTGSASANWNFKYDSYKIQSLTVSIYNGKL